MERYRDRRDAGRHLADRVLELELVDPVVLALPRGGVPVAFEVAQALHAPLEVLVARKLGAPGHPELGIGAIAEGLDEPVVTATAGHLGVTAAELAALVERERAELARRIDRYRGGRPLPPLAGRDVVVVDDGLATGVTAEAALHSLRAHGPRRLVLAVPVGAAEPADRLGRVADEVVCPRQPAGFLAVGAWYDDFRQTTDEEVLHLVATAAPTTAQPTTSQPTTDDPDPVPSQPQVTAPGERTVAIRQVDGTVVHGDLVLPGSARGVVVFAHGSGSSRHSHRNRAVAAALQHAGLATLLLDLLTEDEERAERSTGHLRFDVDLLANRLIGALGWLRGAPDTGALPLGLFGASTGAAAAMVAAAERPDAVAAVVSRGGRPDLAGDRLAEVRAPTLLIVGGADEAVLDLNRQAAAQLRAAPHELVVVPGATHLFEEPGALDVVAERACAWFTQHLVAGPPRP